MSLLRSCFCIANHWASSKTQPFRAKQCSNPSALGDQAFAIIESNGRAGTHASASILEDMQPTAQPSSRRTLGNDEIRLLIYDKKQSRRSGVIACKTVISTLSDINRRAARPYAALSYVWGDAAITKPLICDGVGEQITVNLHHALSAIWNKYPKMHLWADALSITQDNLAERNHQVSLMGNIFRSASRVFVSLGPPLNGDNWVWSFLQRFGDEDASTGRAEFGEWGHKFMEAVDNRLAREVDDLIKRPWFRRAWVRESPATTALKFSVTRRSLCTAL